MMHIPAYVLIYFSELYYKKMFIFRKYVFIKMYNNYFK